jgi:hypothetical protein
MALPNYCIEILWPVLARRNNKFIHLTPRDVRLNVQIRKVCRRLKCCYAQVE